MTRKEIKISDISRHPEEPLVSITNEDLLALPCECGVVDGSSY